MTPSTAPFGKDLIRPVQRLQKKKALKRRKVAGPLKAFVGPRNLEQALEQAVPPQRRQEIAEQSGYDARAMPTPQDRRSSASSPQKEWVGQAIELAREARKRSYAL